jgi:hypothetical protein
MCTHPILIALLHCLKQQQQHQIAPSTTARHIIMTEAETDAIMKSAADCSMGECTVDDVDSLVADLKEQEKILEDRMEKIMNMIAHLQHVNEKEERKTDEVREFVRDMLRVFNTDKPMFPISGFSGDIGKGSQTAYDVLPPKKWTDPAKKK